MHRAIAIGESPTRPYLPTRGNAAAPARTEPSLTQEEAEFAVPKRSGSYSDDLQRRVTGSDLVRNSASAPGTPLHGVGRPRRKRRTRIPDRPNQTLNLWSIMKNCIGKELAKIPMPVNFSEPLSMLQRLTEDFEYASILDRAARCRDPHEQLAHVAAFTVSSYSTTTMRTSKPFNPLLGETYECDRRDDLGWRAISEQVSHHPPAAAMYTEGQDWLAYQEFTMSSKFRGKYLNIIPLGIAHIEFPRSGNHYTWRKVMTTVHNIIVGKLWIDQSGEMEIKNHRTKDVCRLKYYAYSYFSREAPRKVEPENARMYNFTELAVQLNEPEPGVPPTDSRMRPDQRFMEEGRWEEANDVTGRPFKPYDPIWFRKEKDPHTGNVIHMYKGNYWECKEKQDWGTSPDVFS
ncbi:PREDICTED: oxysterol-binding protein 1-like [Priapulus caudatus]|uniref:Oxysterol-binding protein n=1 Tax=Priapulus caudatus TaxID=37621 RepID=A0ABM1DQ22_PRICU|nr:PREDICTED: oxysterol-binding protein 1-like [Priapulus caudatus]